MQDSFGPYVSFTCDDISGNFYLSKSDESKKPLPKCVLVNGSWYSPTEVEGLAGKKQSLQHLGKPLSEYSLSCPLVSKGSSQGCQPVTSVSTQVVDVDLGSACGSVPTPNNTGVLCPPLCASDNPVSSRSYQNSVGSGTNPSTSSSSFIVDPVLFFVKAFRLKRDKESLKKSL